MITNYALPIVQEASRELDYWRWLQSRGTVQVSIEVMQAHPNEAAGNPQVTALFLPRCEHFAPISNWVVGYTPTEVEWVDLISGLVAMVALRQWRANCHCGEIAIPF
jgi:hypothetical protein